MSDGRDPRVPISWLQAVVVVVVVVVVGIGVLVFGANAVLTRFHGVRRGALVGIVTPAFFVVLCVIAGLLRWLQRRGTI